MGLVESRFPRRFAALALAVIVAIGLVASLLVLARKRRANAAQQAVARPLGGVVLAMTRRVPRPEPTVEKSRCAPEPSVPAGPASGTSTLAELARVIRESPESLGSASLGLPTRGSLWGSVELVESEGITPAGDHPWGTEFVVRSIERAVREVKRCHPGTPKLSVGDISRQRGGWLAPHRSHQSGLDADIGYYYLSGPAWYVQAVAQNLDVPRTWALVRALLEGGSVEYVFMDRRVQKLLLGHIATLDDSESAKHYFETENETNAIIRHVPGHGGHFHVRFRDPAAVALGLRLSPLIHRTVITPTARAKPPAKRKALPAKVSVRKLAP